MQFGVPKTITKPVRLNRYLYFLIGFFYPRGYTRGPFLKHSGIRANFRRHGKKVHLMADGFPGAASELQKPPFSALS